MMDQRIANIEKNAREQLVIGLTEFKGHQLLDLRIYVDGDDDLKPTKKGVTVGVRMLPGIIDALVQARTAAINAGVLKAGD